MPQSAAASGEDRRLIDKARTVQWNALASWPEAAFEEDLIRRRYLWTTLVVVNAPEGVRHVLVDNAENYRRSRVARRLFEPSCGPTSLAVSEGETWRRHRRVMAPAFHARRLPVLAPRVVAAAERMMAGWAVRGAAEPVDIQREMDELAVDVTSRLVFSLEADDELAAFGAAIRRYLAEIRPGFGDYLGLPEWLAPGRRRRARAIVGPADRLIYRLIEARRGAPPADDLLGLLATQPGSGEAALSDAEIRDEIVTLFAAGSETTANALSWVWHLLATHPAEEALLHRELEAVLGERPPRFDDIPRLKRTRLIVDETLRLYPPIHRIGREAIAADTVLGHRIPKGATVVISPWVLHRHHRRWAAPERFIPDRFSPDRAAARDRYTYLPFGAGPHVCIGATLAVTELVLLIAAIAQRYRFESIAGVAVEPVGRMTLRVADGLPMWLRRRAQGQR